MKLTKFRIKNYKSIIDSGNCSLNEGITVLAGKNESGKTSILEALEDFNEDKSLKEGTKPINRKSFPEMLLTFRVYKDIVNDCLSQSQLSNISEYNEDEIDITLIKQYKENEAVYCLDDGIKKSLNLFDAKKQVPKEALRELLNLHGWSPPDFENNESLTEYKKEVTDIKSSFIDEPECASLVEACKKLLAFIDICIMEKTNDIKGFLDNVAQSMQKQLPNFILFSSFNDVFPDSININELENNPWAQDLEKVSSFKIKEIMSPDPQKRKNHESSVNIDFENKFEEFWTQDDIKLEVDRDGDTVYFWIIENGTNYKPSQRSKGQQWYLSFYIKIVARMKDEKSNVILIDEPGLYLHPKAQKDLLEVLKDLTTQRTTHPIIFSTHSPYLIESNSLESIRLIEKKDNAKHGTIIYNSIHLATDKDTLTPILTAIGLGLKDSIENIDQKYNVIVEGQSDVYYLQAFQKLYSNSVNFNFINSGGIGNMLNLGAILIGWGTETLYLFDSDKAGKKWEKKLIERCEILEKQIMFVHQKDDMSIEDLFSVADFKKYVLKNEKLEFV